MTLNEIRPTILFAGGIYRDLFTYTPRLPEVGETLMGSHFKMGFGGKTANQAVMCAKLGAATAMFGSLGSDQHGIDYKANFRAYNIDIDCIKTVPDVSSGIASIWVDTSTGDNQIIIIPGSNAALTPADVWLMPKALIGAVQAVVVGLEIPSAVAVAVLELAKKHSIMTITNAAPAADDLDPKIFQFTDVLCVNETEAYTIAGGQQSEQHEVRARRLLTKCPAVVLTLGKGGCLVASRKTDQVVHVPTDEPDKVVDTTGAGDAFVGALAYFLVHHRHLDIEEAARRACVIATISVQAEGTQTSFPDLSQLASHLFS